MRAAFSGEPGQYAYALASQKLDLRPVSKAFNAAFSGRGGGKPNLVQGRVGAASLTCCAIGLQNRTGGDGMTKPEQILQDMALYNAPDVRRIEHAMKVYAWASLFGVQEGLSERGLYTLRLAAALHDIGIHEAEKKHHSSAGVYQEQEGPAIARQLLSLREVPAPVIERVCHLIGRHHTYTDIDGPTASFD